MDLPPELRTHIYEFALVEPSPLTLHSNMDPRRDAVKLTTACNDRVINLAWLQPPLTRVCRQIRSEALPIFYFRNTFLDTAGTRYLHFSDLMIWLRCIGPENCSMIQHIELHMCDREVGFTRDRMDPYGLVHLKGLLNQFTYSYGATSPLDLNILDKMRIRPCVKCVGQTSEIHLEMLKGALKLWFSLRKEENGLSDKAIQEKVYRWALIESGFPKWAEFGNKERIIKKLVRKEQHHQCTIWTCGRLLTWAD